MDVNDLVARTMIVSKKAQKKKFYETAYAFDELLDRLLEMLHSRAHLEQEIPAILPPELQQIH